MDEVTLRDQPSTTEVDEISNESNNRTFADVLNTRMSRRTVLKSGAGAAAVGFVAPLAGCGDDDGGEDENPPVTELGFASLPPNNTTDAVIVPAGYRARVLYAFGDPIVEGIDEFKNDGTDDPATYDRRAGTGHDGLFYFPLPSFDSRSSDRGLLATNHENVFVLGAMHENGPPTIVENVRTVKGEVDRELFAHGVSIVEIAKNASGDFEVVRNSSFNRRIHANTTMNISGPARGHAKMRTAFSPDGTRTRGTLNNCAMGFTPWGTYLTCEENWHTYFRTSEDPRPREKSRYGVDGSSDYRWETAGTETIYTRFDTTPGGGEATADFRNEANTYGWVVEIDPYAPTSTPVKRTALGRIKHEGAWPANPVVGQPLVFYTGDDERNEYIYKFVTEGVWQPGVTDGSVLDTGTLYVAKFNDDGTGEWLPLTMDVPVLAAEFDDLGDLLINTRTAADLVGATPMDRPEWGAVNPDNGEVYITLTNNNSASRGPEGRADVDGPNPRPGNPHGHIIRWREDGDDAAATSFTWDIFIFGANPNPETPGDNNANVSNLDASNAFASPDGLWFDDRNRGILWIQTDDGSITGSVTNNQILAALPGRVGDGGSETIGSQSTIVGAELGPDRLRRFLIGPRGCEVTGIHTTPDGRTMFVNIQHPGGEVPSGLADALLNNWPNPNGDATAAPPPVNGTAPGAARPRPATIVITREDGGRIGAP